jgi:hypothetical protein
MRLFLLAISMALTLQMRLASGSDEFQVFRMLQYDMPFGNALGSRLNQLSMEARTVSAKSSTVARKCVLAKLRELSLEKYRLLVGEYAGALIVLLPAHYDRDTRAVCRQV